MTANGPGPDERTAHRVGGAILAAFGLSIAADQAMVGSATAADRARVALGAIAVLVGVAATVAASLGHHADRRPVADRRRTSARLLIVAAVVMGLTRGLPPLRDLVGHVRADRDEPTTTLVHVVRLALTGVLTAALGYLARRRARR